MIGWFCSYNKRFHERFVIDGDKVKVKWAEIYNELQVPIAEEKTFIKMVLRIFILLEYEKPNISSMVAC